MDASKDQLKETLRSEVRARLRKIGPIDLAASERMQWRLLDSALIAHARVVALYRALPSEPGTSTVAATLSSRGVVICFPVVDEHELSLTFRAAHEEYQRGSLGIEVPHAEAELIALGRIELFVVPALAADERGNRLGRGRGHYDATLAARPEAMRIGLLREAALVPEVPACEHDAPLDALCTESRFIFCSARARGARARGLDLRAGDETT